MGAWGQSPFDSDNFGDDFSDLALKIGRSADVELQRTLAKIERTGDEGDKWAGVGMIIWAYNAGLRCDWDVLIATGYQLIESLQANEEWIASWRAGTNIKKFLDEAEEILSEIKGGYEPPMLPSALTEMFPAQRTPKIRKRRKR